MSAKTKSRYEQKNTDLRTTIEKYAKMSGFPLTKMGCVIGVKSYNTWNSRTLNMDNLTLGELRCACRLLRIPQDELLRSIL